MMISLRRLFLKGRTFSSLPEHMVITFPALSPTMTEGTISSWEKKVGDEVDEVIFFRENALDDDLISSRFF